MSEFQEMSTALYTISLFQPLASPVTFLLMSNKNNQVTQNRISVLVCSALLSGLLGGSASAATTTWTFDNSGSYTFSGALIEVTGGNAQLAETGSPNWYNSSWTKRKPVTIDNTGNVSTLADYQVSVTVAYDSDMQADFDDIRFTDSDGTTLLSYWLESKTDSSTAVFWIKVPSIAGSSNHTIYAYYGNSGVSIASSAANTFAFYDDLDSLAGYSTFGNGTWAIASDATRGSVFEVSVSSNDSGLYKGQALPSSYVADVYVKDTVPEGGGSWGGMLMDMEDADSWYRSGYSEVHGIQIRDNNNGSFTNYVHANVASTSPGIWYKTQAIFKDAISLSVNSDFTASSAYVQQGLAWDGMHIYSSGRSDVGKYDRDGNLIASASHTPTAEHFGGMEFVGNKLYAVLFDSSVTPHKTYIYSYESDLSGETLIKDISEDIGNGGNSLSYKNGYWIVGETGGNTQNYNQHFYVFDSNWSLIKAIQSPYYKNYGGQDSTFKGNSLYVTQHDARMLVFTWDESALDLRLTDALDLGGGRFEGIAYDSTNELFYLQNLTGNKIEFATFPSLSTKKIIYSIPHASESHGVVYHDLTARTQNYVGVGAYRGQRFDQLSVRKFAFPEPVATVGTESNIYSSAVPGLYPTPANAQVFTSLSSFSTTETPNGGDVKYQVSPNEGKAWYWYNGGWSTATAGYSEANTGSVINSNIASLPTGSSEFLFKAFLSSDGTQLVKLSDVTLTYENATSSPTPSSTTPATSSSGGGGHGSRGRGGTSLPVIDLRKRRVVGTHLKESVDAQLKAPASVPAQEQGVTIPEDVERFKKRVCQRVSRRFASVPHVLERVNARLFRRFGFYCD